MRLGTILKSTAIVGLMIVLAFSQSAVIESFDYVSGKSVLSMCSPDAGWSTGWVFDTTSNDFSAISTEGLVYDDMNYEVYNGGNHLQMNMAGGWANVIFDRYLDEMWVDEAGKEYWISLVFQTSQAPTGNTYYITKLFHDAGEICAIGKGGGGTTFTCGSGWPGGAGDDVSSMECVGDPVWLVTKIVCAGSGNSRTYMWIDPDPAGGTPDTNYADVKRGSDLQGGFNKIRVECGGEDSLQVHWDEIRLGTSFEEVAGDVEVSYTMTAREDFNFTVGESIANKCKVDAGWASGWIMDTTSNDFGVVSDEGLVYDDMNYEVANAGAHLQMNMAGGWANSIYDKYLETMHTDEAGKEYWVSLIFQTSQAPTGNTYYITKLFHNDGEICAIGKGGGGTTFTCGSGWPGGAGDDVSSMECVGDPVWLVTKFVCDGTGNARTFMWIDPDPAGGTPDTNYADVKRNSDMQGGFNKIRVECGGEDSLQVHWDEIRVGASFDEITLASTAIDGENEVVASTFELNQNYPNPFNPTTMITYSLRSNEKIRLAVYDMLGKEVEVLVNKVQNTGSYKVNFNAANLSSGVYFYRLETPSGNMTRKMMLLK